MFQHIQHAQKQKDYYYDRFNVYFRAYNLLGCPAHLLPLVEYFQEMFNWWFNQYTQALAVPVTYGGIMDTFLVRDSDEKPVDGETGANE